MTEKIFWFISVFFYGLAVYLANVSVNGSQDVVLDYRFWIVVALGSLSAVLGNFFGTASLNDDEDQEPKQSILGR